MREYRKFYINGEWVQPACPNTLEVINPSTETVAGHICLASAVDVERAVQAAHDAFPAWSQTSRGERVAVLERIIVEYRKRQEDLALAITEEMGAPAQLARGAQVPIGLMHLKTSRDVLRDYAFEQDRGTTRILKEPIGVCALITPWNWPLNQIAAKVCPALATGCTMVLKPSEIAPFSAVIWTEILDAAKLPPGVFNLLNGDGATTGKTLAAHPKVDMVSFTGSTRAGIEVARVAAPTVKRVTQELGGKSPNLLLADADFSLAVPAGVLAAMRNSGQSCNAPTRMLVPADRVGEVNALARRTAESMTIGDPSTSPMLGPLASLAQWNKVQALIGKGLEEGALLVTGGAGRPEGLVAGYFARPTVFSEVTNNMTIAREEIFGPVLSIISYQTLDQAIEIANDTPYGLAAYICGTDSDAARDIAERLRAGQVTINASSVDLLAPFGGYKMSGNGREWGDYGFADYLEIKSVLGYGRPADAPPRLASVPTAPSR